MVLFSDCLTQDETQADGRLVGSAIEAIQEEKNTGPPKATLERRAQSYTDFHHAVTAVLGKDERPWRRNSTNRSRMDEGEIHTNLEHDVHDDLDFADLYNDLEPSLLASSHDEYTYVLTFVCNDSLSH